MMYLKKNVYEALKARMVEIAREEFQDGDEYTSDTVTVYVLEDGTLAPHYSVDGNSKPIFRGIQAIDSAYFSAKEVHYSARTWWGNDLKAIASVAPKTAEAYLAYLHACYAEEMDSEEICGFWDWLTELQEGEAEDAENLNDFACDEIIGDWEHEQLPELLEHQEIDYFEIAEDLLNCFKAMCDYEKLDAIDREELEEYLNSQDTEKIIGVYMALDDYDNNPLFVIHHADGFVKRFFY